MMFWRKNRINSRKNLFREIAPEDILADTNLHDDLKSPCLESKMRVRIGLRSVATLLSIFIIASLIFVGRLWNLQISKGEAFAQQSENNHLNHEIVFTPRGVIFDRNGVKVAWNEPTVKEGTEILKRSYYGSSGLSHVLGYVSYPKKDSTGVYYDTSYSGAEGVEEYFDRQLSGVQGVRIIELNALGEIASQNTITPAIPGESLEISIDAGIQARLYEEIKRLAEDVQFEGGAGIIMNIHTGEIIALTSYPEYSSSVMADGVEQDAIEEYLVSENTPFLNRVTQGLYTPGSIVKPIIAIAALNEGVIEPHETILSTGEIRIENPYVPGTYSTFRDWKAHGRVDIVSALAYSSNVYFYEIGGGFGNRDGLGISNIYRYSKAFKLGVPTGSGLFDETEGVIPNPEWKEEVFGDDWRLGDTYHTSIGQYGFQATPLQMLRAIGAIARNGVLVEPVIRKGEVGMEEIVEIDIPKELYRWVQKGMRESVLVGTASALNTPQVEVAGKTGTAEVGTQKKSVNSWVVGYFPYKSPKYAFAIVMEKGPRANLVGGTAVMRRLLDWMGQNTPEYFE